jgi:hypothetical protein
MIKKTIKISGIILLSVVAAIVLLIAFFWLKIEYGVKITEFQSFDQTEPYVWNKVDLGDSCQCSDGSDYWIYTKKGNSNNLIIHFQGGGACWNDATCTSPLVINPNTGFYFPKINEWLFKAVFSHGMLKNDLDENPLKDWNIVYIPYCTGDLHIGNTENKYTDQDGNDIMVKHYGRINVRNALNWARNNINDPNKVFITGESAGGFGNIFWTPSIVRLFPDSKYYQISDCSFLKSEVLLDAVELWNAETEKNFGFNTSTDLLNSALHPTAEHLENVDIKFFQSHSMFDEVLLRFDVEANNHSTENNDYMHNWSNDMLAAVKNNNESLDNYYYYITDWNQRKNGKTIHTFILYNQFYECIEEEVYFSDWIKEGVINDQPFSAGSYDPVNLIL